MGRRRTYYTSSSSSSSDSEQEHIERKKCRIESNNEVAARRHDRNPIPSTSTADVSYTPPSTTPSNSVDRLEALVEKLIHHQTQPKATIKPFIKPDCIPEFSPGNPNLSCKKWIGKIEQLGSINNWDQETMAFYMQGRLTGLARRWYDNLSTYHLTWAEWKRLLLKTFPEHQDYAATMRKMLDRYKQSHETWEVYYFEKMELVNACEVSGKKAVSCLIDGIKDPTIQAGARAGRYKTPDQLYAEYLSSLKHQMTPFVKPIRPFLKELDKIRPSETSYLKQKQPIQRVNEQRCYNCRQKGHHANKCTKAKIECTTCKRLGHLAKDCRRNIPNRIVDVIDESQKWYYFNCTINGHDTSAYVDTGCGAVLIRQENAKIWNLDIKPTNTTITGYGGYVLCALGEAQATIKIDRVEGVITGFIVPNHIQEVPIMIGQSFLNQPEISMVVMGEEVRLLKHHDLSRVLDIPPRKIPLWAKECRVIPPREVAVVIVTSRGLTKDDVFVQGGYRPIPGREHYIDGCVTNGENGFVSIANMSSQEIKVSDSCILVRGVNCYEDIISPVNSNVLYCSNVSKCSDSFTNPDITYNDQLSEVEVKQLLNLVNEFKNCFTRSTCELGRSSVLKMGIHLKDDNPVVYRPYRLSHHERKIVRDIVTDLLDNGIIRESSSPYSSPILLVKKKNGEQRMCIDYRALNAKTTKDRFPLPRIDDCLEKLKGCNFFTSLDLASGYYQIPMEEASVHKTAFITPDGHYEYLRMPFGLANAPAVFQRTINKVLGNLRYGSALAYMDDILVPSIDFASGLASLREVLISLKEAGLTLRLKKCCFFMEKVDYLGHEISSEGVQPGSRKTDAVSNFPTPTNVHTVRQFLGLASYFRKYINGFATIARPLTSLTKKDMAFVWKEEQQTSFKTLKEKLATRPLLAIYDSELATEVHTDASKIGIGGILLQRQKDNSLRPVMYYSRQTTKEEQRYHSYELETLAVVNSLKQFRVYLVGIYFTVITDCNAIRTTLTKRDLIPRIGRWWLSIQEFTFDIKYRPGHRMAHADALSRNPVDSMFCNIVVSEVNITESDWVLSAQLNDDRCRTIIDVLSRKPMDHEEQELHKGYSMENSRLYRKIDGEKKWVVPKAARRQVVLHFHDGNGHMAAEKTLSAMLKQYWFAGMRRYVKKFVSNCLECLYNKEPGGRKAGYLHPIEKVAEPFDTLHIDHLGPFVRSKKKNAYLIVVVDSFTKFVFMKAAASTQVRPVIVFLENIFENFGVPRRLISDRGSCFTSKQFSEFCTKLNVKHVLNATATPRANGQVERYNRSILQSLAACTDDEERWDMQLSKVKWGLNSTTNSATGKTPYELLFGYAPRGVFESVLSNEVAITSTYDSDLSMTRKAVKDRIAIKQQRQKLYYDKKRCKGKTFKKGDQVLVRKSQSSNQGASKKLLPKYSGPYIITKVLDCDRFVVEDEPGASRSQKKYKGIASLDKIKAFNLGVSSDTDEESETDPTSKN